ncbi:MAG: diacylglycerol kinase [Fimbriimonadaceae bacterium]|nr:diacylglycerol kinase [Fimbriimonadaceae bacterium]
MEPPNLRRFARSFRHAMDGVLDAYRSQRHMRAHFVFMACNAILALIYKLNAIEVAVLMLTITLVIFAEMINTVVEATLNLVCETYHPIARFVKDVAAGAVLVTAVNSCLVGLCIYVNPERLTRLRAVWSGGYQDESALLRALAMSLVLLLIILTAIKVGRPEGSVLTGGAVSGHTAVAFCFAGSLWFIVKDTAVAALAMLLAVGTALIVVQLRLHDPNHRVRTVFYGAILGILVPMIVFGVLARP